jgi:hypothetical protein
MLYMPYYCSTSIRSLHSSPARFSPDTASSIDLKAFSDACTYDYIQGGLVRKKPIPRSVTGILSISGSFEAYCKLR